MHRYRASIDGKGVSKLHCVEADEEAGCIVCCFWPLLLDQDGRPRTYTRYGHVVITRPEGV
jgi:hypothetical protein